MALTLIVLSFLFIQAYGALDQSGCKSNMFCFKSDKDCETSKTCDYFLKFGLNSTDNSRVNIYFSLKKANIKWLALGTNSANTSMMGTRAVVCTRESASSTGVFTSLLPNQDVPTFMNTSTMVMNKGISYVDNVFTCHISRPVAAHGVLSHWNTSQFIIFAWGANLAGGVPSYHGRNNYKRSPIKINLASLSGIYPNSAPVGRGAVLLVTMLAFVSQLFL